MAVYTMELRTIAERQRIFNFPYEIYDEKKRAEFEQAFIRHFYFREICCDTPEKFIWFLRDKMTTVFPYYNELMRTATIEYDIENPYNLTETYTRKSDSIDKANGGSYSVGRVEEERATDTSSTGKSKQTGNETESSESDRESSVQGTTTKGVESETVNSGTKEQRYLDTPQGKLNLLTTDYLTNLTHNSDDGLTMTESSEAGSETRAESESAAASRNAQTSANAESEAHSSETAKNNQRTTADTASRSEAIGTRTEEYTMVRKGNIGVNPASHEINEHIKTQKTLKRIYEMFFDECEDLFLLVY